MKYERISEAVFLRRPNRFIAHVDLHGEEVICHVKNTGRCRELLIPGTRVIVQRAANPQRKTKYDLTAVYKGSRLINIDSYAPNIVFNEFLRGSGLGFQPDIVRPECTHGDSRFDFYTEYGDKKAFIEVKGVTLESDDIVSFPDAPTLRGLKHVRGLMHCLEEGYEAYIVFIVQMKGVKFFEPNRETQSEFADALIEAEKAGVHILAFDCDVAPDSLIVSDSVEIRL
ncbi:MAG: DNA/RNA nuclease SfsA [Candidatus Limivicinus sp.]